MYLAHFYEIGFDKLKEEERDKLIEVQALTIDERELNLGQTEAVESSMLMNMEPNKKTRTQSFKDNKHKIRMSL